jgi:ABC-type phosphate transport system substrate-binding protein
MKTVLLALGFALAAALPASASDYVVVVNADNAAAGEIDRVEVKRLFLMQSPHWRGGEKVRPVELAESGARDTFLSDVLRMGDEDLKRYWIQLSYQRALSPAKVLESEGDVLRYVAEEKGAIGFVRAEAARATRGVKIVFAY